MVEKINSKQFFSIMVVYIIANDLMRGMYIKELQQDTWLPCLIGIFISILLYTFYNFLYKNNQFDSFDNSMKHTIGKFFSKIIYILFICYFITLAFLNIIDVVEVTLTFLIPDYSAILLGLLFVLIIGYLVYKGIEVAARLSVFLLFGIIIIFLAMCFLTLTLYEFQLDNILPIMYNGYKTIIRPSLEMGYAIPFGELFALMIVFEHLDNKESGMKMGYYALIFSGFNLLTITMFNLFIIGPYASAYGLSPALRLARLIDVEEYVQRMDLLLIGFHMNLVFIKVYVLIFASLRLLNIVIPLKPKYQKYSKLAILIIIFGLIVMFIGDYTKLLIFRRKIFIKYISLLFEVLLPLLIITISFIRKDKRKYKPEEIIEYNI